MHSDTQDDQGFITLTAYRKIKQFTLLLLTLGYSGISCAACFVSVGGFNFGVYDVFDAFHRDTTGVLSISCQENKPQDVMITFGPSQTTGTIYSRGMRGTEDTLLYNIFLDAARSTIAGDGTSGGSTVTVQKVSLHKPAQVILYGRIPAGQNVSVGTYSDMMTVTITP